MRRYYFDNIATTRVDDEVLKEMLPYFSEIYAIPSSQFSHQDGILGSDAIEKARERIAACINAEPSEIIFTSGETESNNLAVKGAAYYGKKKRDHLITSPIEPRSVLNSVKKLGKEGFGTSIIKVDGEGFADPDDIKGALTERTSLVSVSYVNHEVGTMQDIERIGTLCAERGVLFHTDASYAFSWFPIDVKKQNISLMTLSADKIHGPKGAGILYKNKNVKIDRLFEGNFNEFYIRPGLENVPAIVGSGKAAELIEKNKENIMKVKPLRDKLIADLLKIDDAVLNGPKDKRVDNNVNVTFYRAEGEAIVLHLDMHGISVITGSACFSESLEPSYVMMALGYTHERAHGSVRFGLSRLSSGVEIEYAAEKARFVVNKLREISPIK